MDSPKALRKQYTGPAVDQSIDYTKYAKVAVKTATCNICKNKDEVVRCDGCTTKWCIKCQERNKEYMGHAVAHFNCLNSPIIYKGDANTLRSWWIANPPSYGVNQQTLAFDACAATASPTQATSSPFAPVPPHNTPAEGLESLSLNSPNTRSKKPAKDSSVRELSGLLGDSIHADANIELKRGQRARQSGSRDKRTRSVSAKDDSDTTDNESDVCVVSHVNTAAAIRAASTPPSSSKTYKTRKKKVKTTPIQTRSQTAQQHFPTTSYTGPWEYTPGAGQGPDQYYPTGQATKEFEASKKFPGKLRQPTTLRHHGKVEDKPTVVGSMHSNVWRPSVPADAPSRGPRQSVPKDLYAAFNLGLGAPNMVRNLQSSPIASGNPTRFNITKVAGNPGNLGTTRSSSVFSNTQPSLTASANATQANIPSFVPPVGSSNNRSTAELIAAEGLAMLASGRAATQCSASIAAEGLVKLPNGQPAPQSEAGIAALADAAATYTIKHTIPPGLTNVAHLSTTGRNAPTTAPFTYKDADGQPMFTLQVAPSFRWVDHGNGIVSICKSLTGNDGQEHIEHAAWIERARQDGTPGSDDSRLAWAFLRRLNND